MSQMDVSVHANNGADCGDLHCRLQDCEEEPDLLQPPLESSNCHSRGNALTPHHAAGARLAESPMSENMDDCLD